MINCPLHRAKQPNRYPIGTLTLFVICLWTSHPLIAYQEIDLQQLLSTGQCPECDLTNAPLAGRNLKNAKLDGADLTEADLRHTDLSRAHLNRAHLINAKVDGADFRGAELRGSHLSGTDLSQVRLIGADLRDADLSHLDIDLDLEFIDLVGVLLEGAKFKGGIRCGAPPGKGGFGCAARPE